MADGPYRRRSARVLLIDAVGRMPHELEQVTGHRWWTLKELAGTGDDVYPFGLVPLLGELLAGRVPDEPVRLPWHH